MGGKCGRLSYFCRLESTESRKCQPWLHDVETPKYIIIESVLFSPFNNWIPTNTISSFMSGYVLSQKGPIEAQYQMRLHYLFPCWETKGRLRILNICNFAKRQYVNVNESEQCQDKATGFNNRFEGNLELGYSLKSQPLFAFGLIGYSAAAINFEWLTDEIHNVHHYKVISFISLVPWMSSLYSFMFFEHPSYFTRLNK